MSIVQKLLKLCPKVNPAACNNQTIIFASLEGQLEVVKLLVKHGGIPATNANSPLLKAASWDRLDVVEFLLAFPSITPNANILNDASDKSPQILLADERTSPTLASSSMKLLNMTCRRQLNRIILFLPHPQVDYRLAYVGSIRGSYIRGFLRSFPAASFEAFDKERPALWKILLDSRIKQLQLVPIFDFD